jgi:hypothetical protein
LYEPLLIFVIVPYRVKEPNLAKRARLLETFKRRLLQRDMSEITPGGRRTFCANYSFAREGFAPCLKVWCPSCFVPVGKKRFLIQAS